MRPRKREGPTVATATSEPSGDGNDAPDRASQSKEQRTHQEVHRLHRGRSCTPLVEIVPDDTWPRLYRIQWPDIALSSPANLSRCCDAARAWAESEFLKDHRKNGAARSLKSLNDFSWSSRRIEQAGQKVARTQKPHFTQRGEVRT